MVFTVKILLIDFWSQNPHSPTTTMSKLPVTTPAWPCQTRRCIRLDILVHCYMVMKGYHEVYLFENISLCNIISFPEVAFTKKVIHCHLMESLPNSFLVNNLPDLSTKAKFTPTLTLLRIPFCISLLFSLTLIGVVVWILFFYSEGGGGWGGGGVVGVASLL